MSDLQRNDWKLEQDRIDLVVSEIKKKEKKLQKNAGTVSSDVLQLRKTFWQDVTVNYDEPDDILETAASIKQQSELLLEREQTFGQMDRQLKTLTRLKYSPYFGRIDFLEKGERGTDKVYLGIASLMDVADENFLIYDWRAPISSLYYDFPPGLAHYQTLEGKIVGEMTLKRQFIIKEAEIKGMFDTGVTIGDEMLQEVLGNNASTQMKSIVATIQREQNQIIRNERSKYVVVQGAAGSGKTSAALQRVAYLLYRYRDTMKSENIMLFSPNPLFNSYVATVLPELGEENMQQATFLEYLNNRIGAEFKIEDSFDQLEFLLKEREDEDYKIRVDGIRFKASLGFKHLIDQFLKQLSERGLIFIDVVFRGEILISKEMIHDYFYKLEPNFSIPNRIELVKEWLLRELKKQVRRERNKEWVEEEIQFLEKEDYLEAYKQLQQKNRFTENTFDDFEQEQNFLKEMVVKEKFKSLFVKVKKLKFIDMLGIYQSLFEGIVNQIGEIPSNWSQICSQTIERLNRTVIAYEDATPFVYLQELIEGRKSNTAIRHIFIDEAQDYTPFQFAFIQRLFPYSKMTLLGDFNQAIFSGATNSPTVLLDFEINGDESETYVLTKTYRSTKEIVQFTSSLLVDGNKIEPFNRTGSKPTIIKAEPALLIDHITNKINKLKHKGYRTIAVICKTAEESKTAYAALKTEFPVHLIEKGTLFYERGVLIIPSYLAKGIEFDAVILYDSSQYKRETERKLFYTVCTRAMHELHLYATEGLSPLMKTISNDTYLFDDQITKN